MNNQFNIIELKEASSLAKTISSKTAQEIIKFIGEHEKSTATQIKKGLNIPASTIHYNLKFLIESQIIDDSEFTYSSKGKQVNHYSLTNKILIIVPEKQKLSNQLKALIPGLLTIGGITGFYFVLKIFKSSSQNILQSSDSILFAETATIKTTSLTSALGSTNTISVSIPWYQSTNFIIGLLFASVCFIGSYFLIKFIQKKRRTISK